MIPQEIVFGYISEQIKAQLCITNKTGLGYAWILHCHVSSFPRRQQTCQYANIRKNYI